MTSWNDGETIQVYVSNHVRQFVTLGGKIINFYPIALIYPANESRK